MNTRLLQILLKLFRVDFLAHFSALTDQDVGAILAGPSETLLIILQQHYGYTCPQAKAAWNDFVLRYIDGHDATGHSGLTNAKHVVVPYSHFGILGKRPLRRIPWSVSSRSMSSARLLC